MTTTETTPELKPCPFCGVPPERGPWFDEEFGVWCVSCDTCGAQTWDNRDANEAAAGWNTRTLPSEVSEAMIEDMDYLTGVAHSLGYPGILDALEALSAAPSQGNAWRTAIDEELVVCHIGTADSFDDPRKALAAIIEWNVKVALDPRVSQRARDLQTAAIERGEHMDGPDGPAPETNQEDGHD